MNLQYPLLALILAIAVAFRVYILTFLPIGGMYFEKLFISDLLNLQISWPSWGMILIGLFNIILIYLIGRRVFNNRVATLATLLYAISPWTAYLEVASSLSILLLFGLLVFCYGLINKGMVITIFGSIVLFYFSILTWIVVPVLIVGAVLNRFLSLRELRVFLIVTLFICLPLAFAILKNPIGVRNVFHQQVTLFADVGLLNTVNSFQGELMENQYSKLGKIIENRYTYFSAHLIFNILNQLTLVTYFTPQHKLLGFSFSPSIFVGFIIPFIFGVLALLKAWKQYGFVLLSLFSLTIPSILSKQSPDLGRLVLFSPVIFFVISYGCHILLNSKSRYRSSLLISTICLVLFQGLVVIVDIALREPVRFSQVIGGN